MKAHCDFLSISTPVDATADGVMGGHVVDVLDAAGVSLEVSNARSQLYRWGDGTLKVTRLSRVLCISASGSLLAHLRSQALYDAYLWALSQSPFRVTRLDAAVDVAARAPPIIAAVCAKARARGVALSRKTVSPRVVEQYLAEDSDGALSGTAYLGSKAADVRAVVYDKRKERIDRGYPDPGPLTRYEIRVRSGMGPSLRDAHDPTSMFFHFASPDLLPLPPGVPPWSSHAEGFTLDPIKPRTPVERMFRVLDDSPDIARLLSLAHQAGPGGVEVLIGRIRRMARQAAAAADAASGAKHAAASAAVTSTTH